MAANRHCAPRLTSSSCHAKRRARACRCVTATTASKHTRERSLASRTTTRVARGEGLERATARVPAIFRITSYDACGNKKVGGGDKFHVSALGPCTPALTVSDEGNGEYEVTYVATVSGSYSICVTLGRTKAQHIGGSPFAVLVASK